MGMKAQDVYAILNGRIGEGGSGAPGKDGFSPVIVENADNNDDVYKLDITTKTGSFTTPNLKGQDGAAGTNGQNGQDGIDGQSAGFGTPTATIDNNVGTPSVSVTATGDDTAKVFHFEFKNLKGETGAQGAQGIQGIQGVKGDKGDKGDPFTVAKVYESVEAMNAGFATDNVSEGGFVIIDTGNVEDDDNAKLYVKGITEYSFITDLSGATGIKGEAGQNGTDGIDGQDGQDGFSPIIVENESNDESTYKLDITTSTESFTTPNLKGATGAQGIQGEAGQDGADGQAATITIGTVTSGSTANVENVGTETSAILNFTLPRGNYIRYAEQDSPSTDSYDNFVNGVGKILIINCSNMEEFNVGDIAIVNYQITDRDYITAQYFVEIDTIGSNYVRGYIKGYTISGTNGKDGVDGQNGIDGQNGADGVDGQDGYSPTVTENIDNTDDVYKLDITTKDSNFTTPNLKGQAGTTVYSELTDKPKINGIELSGEKTLEDLGIQPSGNYLTEETDPTVPAWAKAETKPTYTAEEVGALPNTTLSIIEELGDAITTLSNTVEVLRKSMNGATSVLVNSDSINDTLENETVSTIALVPGTFSEELTLSRNVNLVGYYSTTSANEGDRCSDIISENETVIDGTLIIDGDSNVKLTGLTFTNNSLIEVKNNGTLTMSNCKVVDVEPDAQKSFIIKSIQANPVKLVIENCYFGTNGTNSIGSIYNGFELNCTLKDGSSISNNYFAAEVCTHNVINIYAVEEGATVYINNNHFEYSANAIRIGIKGEPTCTIVCDGNSYDATDAVYVDYAGLLLVQPYGKQTTSFANCTIKINNTVHSDDLQLYYLYAGSGDMQFTDSNKPIIIVDGVTEVQPV